MPKRARQVEHHGTPGTPCAKCSKPIPPITVKGELDDDVYHGGIGCVCCGRQLCEACARELGLLIGTLTQTCKPCGLGPGEPLCRPAAKPYRFVIEVKTDDGGPVDAEHVEAVTALKEGATLEDVKKKLRECARPATAQERIDA